MNHGNSILTSNHFNSKVHLNLISQRSPVCQWDSLRWLYSQNIEAHQGRSRHKPFNTLRSLLLHPNDTPPPSIFRPFHRRSKAIFAKCPLIIRLLKSFPPCFVCFLSSGVRLVVTETYQLSSCKLRMDRGSQDNRWSRGK